ncbi:MAG: oligoendopeptidase F [Schleiferilactobacillus perolens]|uniref:oligoendopeptidase F n=1 Tax=Schleiferilactobacillus perolens TaxID=100468 RepID=UPI0039ECF62E
MTEKKQLRQREDVPEEQTWQLTDLFTDTAAFNLACEELIGQAHDIASHQGTMLHSADELYTTVAAYFRAEELADRIFNYGEHLYNSDMTAAAGQSASAQAQQTVTAFNTATAFVTAALPHITSTQLADFYQKNPKLRRFDFIFTQAQQRQAHILPAGEETLLSALGQTITAPESIYNKLNDADIDFGTMKDSHGNLIPLSKEKIYQLYQSPDRQVRRTAAEKFATAYAHSAYTFAEALQQHVHTQNTVAQLRHYHSAKEMDLASQFIPESVFTTLVDTVHEFLPSLHKYYALRKRVLRLDPLYAYDLSVPLVGEAPLKPTYEKAQQWALAALAVLGDDYVQHLQEEFGNRWIDVAENTGKLSGGYEEDAFGVHPYVLLNWSNTYRAASTLVHESGHAMQSVYADAHQPYWYSQYSMFIAEIASTCNESLLNHYMRSQFQDNHRVQAYLLTESVEDLLNTIFNQTKYAEFEDYAYVTDAQGDSLTPEKLNDKTAALDALYEGDDVAPNPWANNSWARIPHYYMNYYLYQYATSKAVANTLAKRILTDPATAVPQYKEFLSAGASDYPLAIVKKAGIDITKPDYIREALQVFDQQVDELAALLDVE